MNSNAFFLWEKVGKTALTLPGVHERTAYGTLAFYVAKKLFARLKEDGQYWLFIIMNGMYGSNQTPTLSFSPIITKIILYYW